MAENRDAGQSLNSFSGEKAVRAEAAREAEEERRARQNHKRRNKSKRKKNRRFYRLIWWAFVAFTAVFIAHYCISGLNDLLAVNRPSSKATVRIPTQLSEQEVRPADLAKLSGADKAQAKDKNRQVTRQVAEILQKAGVIDNPDFFCLYATLRHADGAFRHGDWELDTKSDYEAIINTLKSNKGRKDTVKVTIPEGKNALDVADLLKKAGVISDADAFLQELRTTAFDESYTMVAELNKNKDKRLYKLEGYLFPDTYTFYRNENPQNVVQVLVDEADAQFTKEVRNKAAAKNMTLDQVVTLASIVQAEAANKKDMLIISSILQNRLVFGKEYDIFTLDCDSTTYYPYHAKANLPKDKADYKSSYDTYKLRGLPPGPICNPGMDAINAVLEPDATSYLYFCHNPKTKQPYYARTASQHQANLKKAGLK